MHDRFSVGEKVSLATVARWQCHHWNPWSRFSGGRSKLEIRVYDRVPVAMEKEAP